MSRPSKWGNPFRVDSAVRNRKIATQSYEYWLRKHPDGILLMTQIGELRGKNLACWCPLGAPCHANVLLRLANAEASKSRFTL